MLARLFVLLLGYFFLIFLIARVFEISSTWLKAGCLASQLLNPFALSVKKLKSILEQRGVSYSGMVEKQDLVELVEACGGITEAESCSVDPESSTEIKEVSEDLSFSGASHFFEEVEDTKAGTWLVDVIPKGRSSLLRKNQWQLLKRKISRFGIRIGTFNCQNDLRLCVKYGWDKPALIISMPKGNLPKGNVILKTYDSKPSVELVFQWISKELSSKITTFNNVKSFIDTFKAKTKDDPTYIVLFSELPHPPMLLGSLSVHFTGRVRFGHVQMSLSDWKTQKYILKGYKINNYFQSIVVFTPEGSWTYGRRKGERLEYGYLELFLRTFHPEVNDVFVTVLVMVNMSCVMELFLMNGGILKRTIHFVWLLTFYNTSLIMLCLPVLALFQLPFLNPVLSFTLKCCRYIMTSDAAALLREYTMCGLQHKGLVFGGYAIYGLLMRLIQNRLKYHFGVEDEDNTMMSAREWFTQDLNYLSNVVDSFPSLRQPQIDYSASGLEDGIELLIRRLAVPELWLRPLIPTDYINKLPVWKFCCSHSKRCCNSRQMTHTCHDSLKLAGMFVAKECAICLEEFRQGCLLLGLPCGHCYHQHCIKEWLCDGSSRSHYCCPVCRWPAYKQKPPVFGERGLHTQIEAF